MVGGRCRGLMVSDILKEKLMKKVDSFSWRRSCRLTIVWRWWRIGGVMERRSWS